MFDCVRHPRFAPRLLVVALFIGMLGAFKPVLFNDGSSIAKAIAMKCQLEMVAEKQTQDYLEAMLYGEGEAPSAPPEAVPEAERRQFVETLFGIDRAVAVVLGLGTLLLLVPRCLEQSPLRHLLPVLSLWLIVEAVGATLNGGKAHSELTVLAHATRWGLPLVLWGMIRNLRRNPPAIRPSSPLTHLAVACTSLTFAAHGWEAWTLHPPFQDLIHGFSGVLGVRISPAGVAAHLKVIGVMDLVLAAVILVWRRPGIFLWMACWGLITALSRPVIMGLEAWPELAVRVANSGLPLLLYFEYQKPGKRSSEPPVSNPHPAHERP